LGKTLGRRRMSEYTKDKLDKLSLVELKVIAKEFMPNNKIVKALTKRM
jgi:hypothetical protein